MTSQYTRSRFAIWNHPSQYISEPMEWRVTPKSKDVIGMAAPARLTGLARVISAPNKQFISVEIDRKQASEIAHWTSALPDHVMRTTAEQEHVISHEGEYVCLDSSYRATQTLPVQGQLVAVRIVPEVARIGSLRKAQLRVTDVFLPDVTAN